ncbi:carbohydrate ABC transporter permease [Paenibacillus frigoriresistens]|uniref:carbohydrate ABC transporter permease n=1 Tax=Paenibacillus alginolyticus TaxID=59839 RepID=UPI001564580F|nr:carbohydrate ABC transporter permease [Paenibacillus frigoriresistens]NRF94508.1 carbohydrate ABC transporter permease [Paenibacillus frigoriresistens]
MASTHSNTKDSYRKNTSLRMKLFKTSSTELIPPFYLWLGLICLAVFTLAPFLFLVISSVREKIDLLSGHLLPQKITFNNYVKLFQGETGSDFLHAIKNSVAVSVWTTVITILMGVFAAYALAKIRFPFRKTALFAILAMQLLPSISIIVPMYIMMRDGITVNIPFTQITLFQTPPLLDTIAGLVVAYTSFSLPFAIWLMAGYFQTISKELEEAAHVDGSGRFGTLFKIIIPLAMPGIAATAIFTMLSAWDEFMFASTFTQTAASKTLPVVIREFIGKHSIDWGLMTAGGFVASLPPVIISLFLYRYIVGGLSAGGVKE